MRHRQPKGLDNKLTRTFATAPHLYSTQSVFAGIRGLLDDVPINQVAGFAKALLDHFAGPAIALRQELVADQAFSDELKEKFNQAKQDFKAGWSVPEPQAVAVGA